MHIQVTNVHTPYLLPPFGFEEHFRLWARAVGWLLDVVQASIDGKIAPTGGTREFDAHLLQSRADAIGPKQGILRPFFNFLDRVNINFAQARSGVGFIFQSGKLLLRKAPEKLMDGFAAHSELCRHLTTDLFTASL